jgi:hypothetical protein
MCSAEFPLLLLLLLNADALLLMHFLSFLPSGVLVLCGSRRRRMLMQPATS